MVIRDLIANHSHTIGHRRLVQGEVWCRLQFRDEKDLNAFASTLRWSAFRFVDPAPAPTATPQPPQTEPPADAKRKR